MKKKLEVGTKVQFTDMCGTKRQGKIVRLDADGKFSVQYTMEEKKTAWVMQFTKAELRVIKDNGKS